MKNFTAQVVFKTMYGYRYLQEFHSDKPPRYINQGILQIGDTYLNAINVEDYALIKNK